MKEKEFLDNLFERYPAHNVVSALHFEYGNHLNKLLGKISSPKSLSKKKKHIKTIAIYYHRYYQGGVERVISLQIPMFLRMGYKIVFITQEIEPDKEFEIDSRVIRCLLPKTFIDGRARVFQEIICKYDVDLVLYHAGSSGMLLFDLMLTKALGAQFWVMRHELSVQDMGILSRYLTGVLNSYKLADRVLVLSKMEEDFFRLIGAKATYIPNPVQFSAENVDYSKNDGYILWLGRLDVRQKNYREALDIMKKLVAERPQAKMVILGSEQTPGSEAYIKRFIKTNKLESNIEWHPHTMDVKSFYKKAKIHLVTSSYESFPMMIIESKSFGIPLVIYDLPYLELLKDGKGYISVPQGDQDSAVDALKKMFDDDVLCEKMSSDALDSINRFKEYDLPAKWSSLLNSEDDGFQDGVNIDNIKIFIKTLFQHYDKGVLHYNTLTADLRKTSNDSKEKFEKLEIAHKELEEKRKKLDISNRENSKSLKQASLKLKKAKRLKDFSVFKYLKYKILSKIAFWKIGYYREKYNHQKAMYRMMREL